MKPYRSMIAVTFAVAAAFAGHAALAADSGTLTRAEGLRTKPFADAKVLAPLAAGTKVNIILRKGGWYQVTAAGRTGWVRMLSVRRRAAAQTSITGIASVASGRAGTGKVVTTTGVRGLDSGDLGAAVFNEAQIARAENYRVTRKDAQAFARQGGLVAVNAPALPGPDDRKN